MTRGDDPPYDSASHETCRELLPWYVNQSLDELESLSVGAHLERCEACQDELASLTELQRAVREQPDPAPANPDTPVVPPSLGPPRIGRAGGVWRGIVMGQAAAIVVLSLALFWQAGTAPREFVLRSDPEPASVVDAPTFRVVFTDSTTQSDMNELLRALELEIVAGPTRAGAYAVQRSAAGHVDSGPTRETRRDLEPLRTLRNSPFVRLAEPVTSLDVEGI